MRTFRALMLPVFSHHARGDWYEKVEKNLECIQLECWPIHEVHKFVNCETTPYVYAECLSTCGSKFDFSPEESKEYLDETWETLCSVDSNQHTLYSTPLYGCAQIDCARWLRLAKIGGAKEKKFSMTSFKASSTNAPPAKLQGVNYLEALRHFQQCISSECVTILDGDNSFECQETPYAYSTCAGRCYGKANFHSDIDAGIKQFIDNMCSSHLHGFRQAPYNCVSKDDEVDCAKFVRLVREEAEKNGTKTLVKSLEPVKESLKTVNSLKELINLFQSTKGKTVLRNLGFSNMNELGAALRRFKNRLSSARQRAHTTSALRVLEQDVSREDVELLLRAAHLSMEDERDESDSLDELIKAIEEVPESVRIGAEVIDPPRDTNGASIVESEDGVAGKTGASSPKTHVFSPFVVTIAASIYFS